MERVLWVRAASLAAVAAAATLATSAVGAEVVPAERPVNARRMAEQRAEEAGRPTELSRLLGVWRGTYVCAQGLTGLTLTISGSAADALDAEFEFYAVPQNPRVPSGRFKMSGVFSPATRTLDLRPGRWLQRPPSYLTVGLSTSVNFDAGEMVGTVDGPGCGPVRLTRGVPVAALRAAPEAETVGDRGPA